MFLFQKIDKNVKFNSNLMFACVRVRQGAFLSENRKCYPSKAVPSLQFFTLEMRERKAYLENRRDQTCLSFSTRSPLQSMTDSSMFHCTLPHDYLQILKSKS